MVNFVRLGALAGITAASALLLAACAPSIPSAADLVGTWSSKGGALIELHSNGKCMVSDVPRGVALGTSSSGDPFDAACSWQVGGDDGAKRGSDGTPFVTVFFEHDPDAPTSGITLSVASQSELYVLLGDPDLDNRYKFEKTG